MPAYNSRETVGAAIQSVLFQTHQNLELIIVDDGSTDGTSETISHFLDERITVIRHDKNQGQGTARNAAIAAATGDWLTLIDADDLWARKRLEILLEAANRLGSRVMIADDIYEFYQVDGGIRLWRRVWKQQIGYEETTTKINLASYLSYKRTVMQPLIPLQVITDYKIEYPTDAVAEDLEFYIRLMKVGGLELHLIDFPGYYYRRTPNSMSTHPERYKLTKNVLKKVLDELEFSDADKLAINMKIERLDRSIAYMPLLETLKRRQLGEFCRICISRPAGLFELIRRLPGTLYYRIQVFFDKGSSR